MTAFEQVNQALAACPYPVTQVPVRGTGQIYLSFFQVSSRLVRASNGARRVISTMQVDIWSRQAVSPEVYVVAKALQHAGLTVSSWGPQIYEEDTRWHHMPITCQAAEVFE